MNAAEFEKGDEEEFMERLRLLSVLEETGDWGDHWSPSAVLNSSDIYISNAGIIYYLFYLFYLLHLFYFILFIVFIFFVLLFCFVYTHALSVNFLSFCMPSPVFAASSLSFTLLYRCLLCICILSLVQLLPVFVFILLFILLFYALLFSLMLFFLSLFVGFIVLLTSFCCL